MSESKIAYESWREEQNRKDEENLKTVAKILFDIGLRVHWSSNTDAEVGLIIDEKCVVRTGIGENVTVNFWNHEDADLKQKIKNALGKKVTFANYPFTSGRPPVGEPVF